MIKKTKFMIEATVPLLFEVEAASPEEALEKMGREWDVTINTPGIVYNGWADVGDWFEIEETSNDQED